MCKCETKQKIVSLLDFKVNSAFFVVSINYEIILERNLSVEMKVRLYKLNNAANDVL